MTAKMQQLHVATIQVVLDTENGKYAPEDMLSELLRGNVVDWSYLKLGGQYLYPTAVFAPMPYNEGNAFRVAK